MKAYLSHEADQEFIREIQYYLIEGGSEVASAFVSEFETIVAFLCEHPDLGATWGKNRRRFSLRKFPFHVIYYVQQEELRVVALAHHRRRPEYWKSRT